MQRIEAGTAADVPVIEPGEAARWVPSTVSGGPGSLVSWATLGREGRRHALVSSGHNHSRTVHPSRPSWGNRPVPLRETVRERLFNTDVRAAGS
jgi:hypothetical protein